MKMKVKKIMFALCLCFIGVVGMGGVVTIKATSASITLSSKSKEVQKGDAFSLVLSLESNDIIGGFEGYISYDENLVEFETGGNHISGGGGILRISDLDSEQQSESKKYGIKFRAKKKGECTFKISDTPMVYNADGDELSVSSNQFVLSIINSETMSKNNKLSKLLISPGELNQEYSNDITAYKTEVSYEEDMLFVSAVPEDEEATIELEGNENLQVGKNFVHIIVTAPSGDTRDVQIEVTRLGEGEIPESEKEEEEEQEEIPSNKTEVVEKNDELFLVTNHQFTVVSLEDESKIPEGYEVSTIKIDSHTIPAYISVEDEKSEFVLLYLKNDLNEEGFYQYDRVEKTIQRYHEEKEFTITPDENDPIANPNNNAVSSALIVIAILSGICIVLTIVIVAIILKHKKD